MLKKFNEKYDKILNEIRLNSFCEMNKQSLILQCPFNSIKIDHLIYEMNENVYPIPKELLSYLVKEIFDNGFYYTNEISIKFIIDKINKSTNKDKLLFDIEKIKAEKDKTLLFYCLPYKKDIWIKELKHLFTEDKIIENFEKFSNSYGVQGTYHYGYLIIINADKLHELKDIEEVVEHELIHLFESINKTDYDKIELSQQLIQVLKHPNEYKTYIVNVLNRLDSLFDKSVSHLSLEDDEITRKKFLDNLFCLAETIDNDDKFISFFKQFDSSLLLEHSLRFFWCMVQWKLPEFKDFKRIVFEHFNVEE